MPLVNDCSPPIDLKGKTKLNIGSGKSTILYPDLRVSHFNIDVREYEGVDLLADMRLIEFPEETFDEILFKDCLDHVTFVEGKAMLRKISGWLKKGGILQIHTPNLRFLAGVLSQRDDHEAIKWLYGTDGEGSTFYGSNVIRWCYSKEALRKYLELNGLKIVDIVEDCGGFGLSATAMKP